MCGICGAFSYSLSEGEIDNVRQLFICSSVRGLDSAGAFGVFEKNVKGKYSNPVLYHKAVTDPTELLRRTAKSLFVPSLDRNTDLQALVCHNRLATVGEIKKENAHPFVLQNVSGVHNGTIGHKWADGPKNGTDSEALYWQINERGIKDPIKELGSGWGNAYALVFWDRRNKSLNFLRNNDRPLSYAIAGSTLYYASEPMMLEWIMARNRINAKPIMFPAHKLYTYYLGERDPIRALEVQDLTPPTRVYSSHWNSRTDLRKGVEEFAPSIEFGYVRVLSGEIEHGKRATYRRICWLRNEDHEVVYSGIVVDPDKTPVVVAKPSEDKTLALPAPRLIPPPAISVNGTALDLILGNLADVKAASRFRPQDQEVDPSEDVPFRKPDEWDERTLGSSTGNTASAPLASHAELVEKLSNSGTVLIRHFNGRDRCVFKVLGTHVIADTIEEAVVVFKRMRRFDTLSELQQKYLDAQIKQWVKRATAELSESEQSKPTPSTTKLNDPTSDLFRDCDQGLSDNHDSLDDQTLALISENDNDNPEDRAEMIFDLDGNVLPIDDFDRILLEGCTGCGLPPDLDAVEIDEEHVDGYFYKGDTGSVQFQCSVSKLGGCACFGSKPARREALN